MADQAVLASLRRDLNRIAQSLRQVIAASSATDVRQTAAILAVAERSQRFGMLIDPLAAGFTTQVISWPQAFPDAVYLVIPTVAVTSAQLGQVFVQAGAKTAEGCTLVLRNTSGVPTACIVDVMAIRT